VDEIIGRAAARWVAVVTRRPRVALALAGLLTVGCAVYAAFNLRVDANPDAMISDDLPFRVAEREFRNTFRTTDDAILIVIDGDSASTAARAADALAERVAADKKLFANVYVPFGGPYFQRHALLYRDLPDLERLADRLAQVQPLVARIEQDPSLVGVSDLLAQALETQRSDKPLEIDLGQALDRVSEAAEAASANRRAPDPWGDALIGGSFSEKAKHRVVWVEPRRDYGDLLYGAPAVAAIRQAVRDLELDPEHGVTVRLSGGDVLNYEEMLAVGRQGKIVGVASFVLFSFAVFFGLRSGRTILALVTSLATSLVWTNAFAALVIDHLNQVSAVFNVLIVGLGGEFGIHVCMRYAEVRSSGVEREHALVDIGSSIGSSLFSSAVTTAIGFLVFLPTDYRAVAELGLISGGGMVLSLISSLTVLPAMLALGPVEPGPGRFPVDSEWARRLRQVPLRYARAIRWGASIVAIATIGFVPRLGFDHNPINLRDPRTESVQAMNDLLSHSGNSPWRIDATAASLESADELTKELRALPIVERAITLTDYVPDDQDAKLDVLATMELFLPPGVEPGPPRTAPEERGALAKLATEIERTVAMTKDERLRASAQRLIAALDPFVAGRGDYELLRRNVVGWLPQQIADLRTLLSAGHVSTEDLPLEIRQRMLASDGRARIEVTAREDLSKGAALETFVDQVRAIVPLVSGAAVNTLEWGRITSGAMKQALTTGVLCMLLFLYLLWRNLWDTLLAFFPLALAAAITCMLMVITGTSFNFANVIVLPMLIGMGVDNGVHLVHRHRTEPQEREVLATSTARAVFFAALTTMLSFGSLAFAPHRGMAAIGQMLTVGVVATFLCYVVVLPAVLEWDDQRRRNTQ
jgi:hopanoid biosynthesis associated RND transporter like protein HpnN